MAVCKAYQSMPKYVIYSKISWPKKVKNRDCKKSLALGIMLVFVVFHYSSEEPLDFGHNFDSCGARMSTLYTVA